MTALRNTSQVRRVGVVQEVTVVPKQKARQFLAKQEQDWTWRDLRDYVVVEIEQRFGTFPHDPRKEASIFKSFLERWGSKAPGIARYVFEVCDGRWGGSPVTVYRFTKGSDPYFAAKIADRVVEEPIAGW